MSSISFSLRKPTMTWLSMCNLLPMYNHVPLNANCSLKYAEGPDSCHYDRLVVLLVSRVLRSDDSLLSLEKSL